MQRVSETFIINPFLGSVSSVDKYSFLLKGKLLPLTIKKQVALEKNGKISEKTIFNHGLSHVYQVLVQKYLKLQFNLSSSPIWI